MNPFLKKHARFYSLYLAGGFFVFALAWFYVKGSSVQGAAGPHASALPISLNKDFLPDASNVTRSATEQLEALRSQVTAAPTDTMHMVRLARMLRNAHQADEACTYYVRYLALRPANRQAWLDLAQSLGELNRWQEAQEATETMLTHYPNDPTGLYNLGAIHANQAQIDEARQIWARVSSQTADLAVAEKAETSLNRLTSFLKP